MRIFPLAIRREPCYNNRVLHIKDRDRDTVSFRLSLTESVRMLKGRREPES